MLVDLKERFIANNFALQKFAQLPTFNQIQAEYIWTYGTDSSFCSKTKTLDFVPSSIEAFPISSFDATLAGDSRNSCSDVLLKPIAFFRDPFRLGDNKLVLCETVDDNFQPHTSNQRYRCAEVMKLFGYHRPWFGMEQEYTLLGTDLRPLGLNNTLLNMTQNNHYCAVGYNKCFGRAIAEAHYRSCLYAGVRVSTINSEATPGKHKFKVGICEGIEMGDHLIMARFILYRVAEEFGVIASLNPETFLGWCKSKCFTNFSTDKMRAQGGYSEIIMVTEKLCRTSNDYSTCCYCSKRNENCFHEKANYGVGCHGVSIRISRRTQINGFGYFKDCRPYSNCDPYHITQSLVESCCTNDATNSHFETNYAPSHNTSPASMAESLIPKNNIIIVNPPADDSHFLKRKLTEPLSIQQRLKHGLLAPDTVEKIANVANKNICGDYTTNQCINEPSTSNTLLMSIDNNLERYLDQNNIQDFLSNFDFQNDDWFGDFNQSDENNGSVAINLIPTSPEEMQCEEEVVVLNDVNRIITPNSSNDAKSQVEEQFCNSQGTKTSETSSTALNPDRTISLDPLPSSTAESNNTIVNWKLTPLDSTRRSVDYYSRRDQATGNDVLKQVTKRRMDKTSVTQNSQNKENAKIEKHHLPSNHLNSIPIESVSHIMISKRAPNNRRSRSMLNSSSTNQTRDEEFYLVASPIDPMFYQEQPSTSYCSLIKRAIDRAKESDGNQHEEIDISSNSSINVIELSPSRKSLNEFSSLNFSELVNPETLISPLKPFEEYLRVVKSPTMQNSNKENETPDYNWYEESEIDSDADTTLRNEHPEDGELPLSPAHRYNKTNRRSSDFKFERSSRIRTETHLSDGSREDHPSPSKRSRYRLRSTRHNRSPLMHSDHQNRQRDYTDRDERRYSSHKYGSFANTRNSKNAERRIRKL